MSAADESALDALAAALAPRVVRLLREQAGADDGLAELLASAGFELDPNERPNAPALAQPRAKRRGPRDAHKTRAHAHLG